MTTQSGFLIFFKFLLSDIRMHKFFSFVQYLLQPILSFFSDKWRNWKNKKLLLTTCSPVDHDHIGEKFSNAEIELVMGKLGIECDRPDGEFFGAEEISALFEEENSLDEVREAFDVFDENRDGFIDETELQRVLRRLGLEEVAEVEECKRMIRAFDENGDGLIDVCEFVKFMEKCFC